MRPDPVAVDHIRLILWAFGVPSIAALLASMSYLFWPARDREPDREVHTPRHAAGRPPADEVDPPTVPIGRAALAAWWAALPPADDEPTPIFRTVGQVPTFDNDWTWLTTPWDAPWLDRDLALPRLITPGPLCDRALIGGTS